MSTSNQIEQTDASNLSKYYKAYICGQPLQTNCLPESWRPRRIQSITVTIMRLTMSFFKPVPQNSTIVLVLDLLIQLIAVRITWSGKDHFCYLGLRRYTLWTFHSCCIIKKHLLVIFDSSIRFILVIVYFAITYERLPYTSRENLYSVYIYFSQNCKWCIQPLGYNVMS